jgi:hypothetical protein
VSVAEGSVRVAEMTGQVVMTEPLAGMVSLIMGSWPSYLRVKRVIQSAAFPALPGFAAAIALPAFGFLASRSILGYNPKVADSQR